MIPLRYALTSDEGDDGIGYGFQGLRRDLPIVLGLLALTLIPFWFLHDLWWTLMGVSDGSGSTLAIPQGEASAWISQHMTLAGQALAALSMVELCAIHLLGVALPEELFYRGYLQPKLCGLFTDRAIGRGFVWNHGIALAAGLFALAHFLGEYNPARLGPFFPALLFGLPAAPRREHRECGPASCVLQCRRGAPLRRNGGEVADRLRNNRCA